MLKRKQIDEMLDDLRKRVREHDTFEMYNLQSYRDVKAKSLKAKSSSSVFVPTIIDQELIDQIRNSLQHFPKFSFPSRMESIKLSKYREYIRVLTDKELKIEVFEADETWKLVEVKKEWKRRND